tara:strand:+ start:558 stop:983 length:426 start_codon:yes stop_codon:yes gene_type:complete
MFNEKDKNTIVDAITSAELNTSGEIRVHIDKKCKIDPIDKAIEIFEKLGMQNTKERNGVLIYVATANNKLAIIGDKGINNVVEEHFWDDIKNEMITHFKNGEFALGLSNGIIKSGEQLKTHFPYNSDDTNELSNEISFGDE